MKFLMNRLRLSDFEKIATGWPKYGLYGMKNLYKNPVCENCSKVVPKTNLQIHQELIALRIVPLILTLYFRRRKNWK